MLVFPGEGSRTHKILFRSEQNFVRSNRAMFPRGGYYGLGAEAASILARYLAGSFLKSFRQALQQKRTRRSGLPASLWM